MRRNLYIKDEDWKLIKRTAAQQNRSASNYLVDLHRLFFLELTPEELSEKQKNTTASDAVDKLVEENITTADKDIFFKPQPKKGKK